MIALNLNQYEAIVVRVALEADALARERRGAVHSAAEERALVHRIEMLLETASARPWSASEPFAEQSAP